MYFNFKLIKLFFALYCLELNCIFELLLYHPYLPLSKFVLPIYYGAMYYCCEFSSLYSGIMIKSVFSFVLIKLRDLLVFIGICLYIHVIDKR